MKFIFIIILLAIIAGKIEPRSCFENLPRYEKPSVEPETIRFR